MDLSKRLPDEADSQAMKKDSVPVARWQQLLDHKELVFRICLGMCRNSDDAGDLTQETFCKAFSRHEALAKLTDDEHLKLWLCKVARTTCLDHLRKTKLRTFFSFVPEESTSEAKDPEALMLHAERISLFRAALSKLPRRQHEALVLREYGQLSYQEISALLGIKEGTIMSILLRARRKVHASVQEAFHEKQ
ncbi:MAG: sigma-70 family RNA polymerase sigma factor [Candidatus Aminicenantes bacterium]|nr:sigma-70 family RNA polymerase sigma factor [Candidatus Aminicenantes bacterium]